MFDGLNALPWFELKHAYGSAEEVPMWLRQLASYDDDIRQEALHHLGGSICHQGWICPATAYAVPYLLELLQKPDILAKDAILEFLARIATANPDLHEARWRKNTRVPEWNVPEHIPFKNAREEVGRGLASYLTLLDSADLAVRLQAANVLLRVASLTPDLQSFLVERLRQEPERNARANLILLLGALSAPESALLAFFTELVQTSEDDLIVFCSALAIAWSAKDETPDNIVQILVDVTLQPQKQLAAAYRDLPCMQVSCLRDAVLALGNLQPVRLQPFVPALLEALPLAEDWHVITLAEMLLFIHFFGKQPEDRQQWTLQELTTQQIAVLALCCDQVDLWYDQVLSPDLPRLLRGYGLPDKQQMLADFLAYEMHPYVRRSHRFDSPDPTEHSWYDSFYQEVQGKFCQHLSEMYPEIRSRVIARGVLGDDLFLVDREIIFRVPASPAAVAMLKRESALLCCLHERIVFPLPDPLYSDLKGSEFGQIFMGYRKLPGKPLYKEMLESIDGEEIVARLVPRIASFLYELHHIPAADLNDIGLPIVHERKRYEELYFQVLQDLFPHLEPALCILIAANFEQFLDTPQHFYLTPVLIHGALSPQKILYNAQLQSISGIVGFTQAGLGDPAYDFATLGYSKELLQLGEHAYPGLSQLWQRIQFYMNAAILQKLFVRSGQHNGESIACRYDLRSLLTFSAWKE